MRLLLQHYTRYGYPEPALLGPHVVRLKPAHHTKAKVLSYALRVEQPHRVHWQHDPWGNELARLTFLDDVGLESLDLLVEIALEIRPVNPFDFYVEPRCAELPFEYPDDLRRELAPFFAVDDPAYARADRFAEFTGSLPKGGNTIDYLVELNRRVKEEVRYVIREEPGTFTPEQTLTEKRGSCRDSAALLVAALRARGLAARFVSGYLVQLADEGMLPDQPRGVGRDVVDLHAWAEVFLPGAGWIGLDGTSGLLCGEGHVPLACTATPALAAPVDGTTTVLSDDFRFEMRIGRVGHEPTPTTPYAEETWNQLLAAGDAIDARLREHDVVLTMGGEPTFNARDDVDLPEWLGEALGPSKWRHGLALAQALLERRAKGGVLVHRTGKWYPGESLPRWALDIVARRDGAPIWSRPQGVLASPTGQDAQRLAEALAKRLDLDGVHPAYEDPWPHTLDEQRLPVDVDPLALDLDSGEERRRLAHVLSRGLGRPVGFVLPLGRTAAGWVTERWKFRRDHLFLLPGDSPIGLRLPLGSLAAVAVPEPPEEPYSPPDPRRGDPDEAQERVRVAGLAPAPTLAGVRTAVCVEARGGSLFVFLPPLPTGEDFLALVSAIDAAVDDAGLTTPACVLLEGYAPPSSPALTRFAVTPDPGVLEVNVAPTTDLRAYSALAHDVFDAALHVGLHAEKYLLDGRQAGSGGGHHLTLGGPTPLASPFLRRPDLLASLITFVQHHPVLSYLFSGLFVGPTSQAPRVDEARHDALYELEIALTRAFAARDESPPPWLSDALFRHLLVDVSGNTHRTELCIDKLFDPATPHGRQGLVELRAFEMPPHPRMMVAQMALVRAIVASFVAEPYAAPLARFGLALHDRYLLPYFLGRDLEDVLAHLSTRGLSLPLAAYQPFLELRCPRIGVLQAGDVTLEVRNAIEPWPVLGEEASGGGTSRYVDSSMERIEVRAEGLVPERHVVLVNGHLLPLHATSTAGRAVAGVRFRAWAPAHSLHPHVGIHHPVRLDVLDTWARRSLGACAYHVWHPEGRAFDAPPLTRFEATARRAQRFTTEGPLPWPVVAAPAAAHPDAPYTLDLRRLPVDRSPPRPGQRYRDEPVEGGHV
ncbi:MAG: transglutaminase family protein [Myxococcales bacterium]|nr:transglutaminase family protein [Myxococcales bacterium]